MKKSIFKNLSSALQHTCMAASVALLATGLFSCSKDEPADDGSTVELPNQRVYILNEGNWNMNNAGISLFDPTAGTLLYDDLFKTQNGLMLGDNAQDLVEYDNSVYVAVGGSNYLARLNKALVEQARVSFAADPELQGSVRKLAFHKGFVYASFWGGVVAKIDASSLEVVAKLHIGHNLEGLAVCNGKLYVADSYDIVADPTTGYNNYIYQNMLYVVDIDKFQAEGAVTVASNPNLVMEHEGKVFVISWGNYFDQGYMCQMVDPSANNNVTIIGAATHMTGGKGKVYLVDSETDWSTYTVTNKWFAFDIKSKTVSEEPFLQNIPQGLAKESVYVFETDPENGDFYIGVTHYSAANGDMFRFSKDGTLIGSFDTGGQNPRRVVFTKK